MMAKWTKWLDLESTFSGFRFFRIIFSIKTKLKTVTYRVCECSVAEVNTHLHTDPEESSDEVVTFENTLLLELWELN